MGLSLSISFFFVFLFFFFFGCLFFKRPGEALVRPSRSQKAISFHRRGRTNRARANHAAPRAVMEESSVLRARRQRGLGHPTPTPTLVLAAAGRRGAPPAFRPQGQICLAGSRLIVGKRKSRFQVARPPARPTYKAIKVGDPPIRRRDHGIGSSAKSHRDKGWQATSTSLAQSPASRVLIRRPRSPGPASAGRGRLLRGRPSSPTSSRDSRPDSGKEKCSARC